MSIDMKDHKAHRYSVSTETIPMRKSQQLGNMFPRKVIIQILVLGTTFLILYFSVLENLVKNWWSDPNYSHGFLIPLMSLFFVWDRRDRILLLSPSPNTLGLSVMISGIILLIMGNIAAELFTMRFSMIIVIAGLVLYLLGTQYLKLFLLPILFLLLMIPIPFIIFNEIAFPLQLIAAKSATSVLNLLNIPVLREGNLISLSNTTLEVAEACSGIRSLVSLIALATVFAYFTQIKFWKQAFLVISAIPIAIIANAFRVSGTGILAYFFGEGMAHGFYHSFSGWVVFIVAFILMGTVGLLLKRIKT